MKFMQVKLPIHLRYTARPPDYTQILRNFPTAVLLKTEMESWAIR